MPLPARVFSQLHMLLSFFLIIYMYAVDIITFMCAYDLYICALHACVFIWMCANMFVCMCGRDEQEFANIRDNYKI